MACVQIQRFSLYKQIELFQGTQAFMRDKIGKAAADKFFGEGYYVVAMGANDFINNYLLPVYSDSWTYTGDTFVKYMVSTLEAQLKLLHALGARRLTFFGLGPMGCIPLQRYLTSSGGCQESTNKLARSFNTQAAALLERLSASLPNATFRFGEAYDYFQDIIDRPYMYGFNNSRAPCCTLGRIRPHAHLHAAVHAVQGPQQVRVLGRVPPHGQGQRAHRTRDAQEAQHHRRQQRHIQLADGRTHGRIQFLLGFCFCNVTEESKVTAREGL